MRKLTIALIAALALAPALPGVALARHVIHCPHYQNCVGTELADYIIGRDGATRSALAAETTW
jgi:hypothetical protein